ncbi:MAG: fumarylacetoacetate hydrolase family protein [Dictyoglomus turgidum]|uniref:5-carboxymethyl-2-hydroxymuconate Delta-isomerase n=1 Tax=Dictyoglomus turgidum (strain DSM 6724 / Z-1310) TaxID=515635 RepID=B8E1S5_DICTD|nr:MULTISPECIES: fumarylacetoacetate hydrolase family protein [Dictyoglomus]ACK41708.1 5-carboxymethyl-2-hydroxymuconate Delta-isomerase [Dictyoglomus turgidum DSM 6724]HBU31798.1 FAA hydrolase family protein [Dictyoglomus sp.]
MKIANLKSGERFFIGLLFEDKILNLTKAILMYSSIYEKNLRYVEKIDDILYMDNLQEYLNKVQDFIFEHNLIYSLTEEKYKFLPPIIKPQKILALGRNYVEHAKELGHKVPREPVFFSKSPSSLIAHEEEIVYPNFLTRVDPEVELGVIIKKRGKYIKEENAMDYVLGYTVVNDVTARDMQAEDFSNTNPWFRSKSFDTFCPVGPYLVLKEGIKDPHNLNIELRVNGEMRQKDNTKNMIFKIPQIISYISKHLTLQAGDIIATGTPSGISPIYPGDTVECIVEKVGVLRNEVVNEDL